jgi:hypothetical protein
MMYADDNFGGLAWGQKPAMIEPCPLKLKESSQTRRAGTNLTISWPLANAGFIVQSRTNLALGDWLNVTSPAPQIVGNQWQVALPPPGDGGSAYYRLSK